MSDPAATSPIDSPSRNVLVLMCDQLRYDAIACHGNPYVSTPNIDRLAARSQRFTRAYCNSPICGPTRHSLATGLLPHQHGVIDNTAMPTPGMYTVAHHLQDAGFGTACFGHMHWQRIADTPDPNTFTDHGYQHYGTMLPDNESLSQAKQKHWMWEHCQGTINMVGGPSMLDDDETFSCQIADATIAHLRSWHAAGQRFLCWSSFNDPHPPFFPTRERFAKYSEMPLPPPRSRPADARPASHEIPSKPDWQNLTRLGHLAMKAGYYGLIEQADHHLGRILDVLDELGLWENTTVIFTVDHGEMMGDFGCYMKGVMWEQASHIPFYVCHPGVAPGERHELVQHVDVFPTICELTGIAPRSGLHGDSLAPLLVDRTDTADWQDRLLHAQLNELVMLRHSRWKLVLQAGRPQYLFDMDSDPQEHYDQRETQPELVEALMARCRQEHPGVLDPSSRPAPNPARRRKKSKPRVVYLEVP